MVAQVNEPVINRQEIRDVVKQTKVIHRTGDKSRSMGNPMSEPGEREKRYSRASRVGNR